MIVLGEINYIKQQILEEHKARLESMEKLS
jgi:hypothetical protein